MPSRRPGRAGIVILAIATALFVATCVVVPAPARALSYPIVPIGLDRWFVANITGAEVAPGGGGTIGFTVGDPLVGVTLTNVSLTWQIYAFNAFPGNATSTVGVSAPPVLTSGSESGPSANFTYARLTAGQSVAGTVGVRTSATTPAGTFAVRSALRFSEGSAAFLLESRGWFTPAAWSSATTGVNGSVDLNLTALGVSGILPETSILVSSSNLDVALYAVLGAGLVLVGLAAWLYLRPSKSSSGERNGPGAIHAPRAFGSKRTRDGDSRSN